MCPTVQTLDDASSTITLTSTSGARLGSSHGLGAKHFSYDKKEKFYENPPICSKFTGVSIDRDGGGCRRVN